MRFSPVLLLLTIASPLAAQGRMIQEGVELNRGELVRLDPARVVLDRREPLKLDKAQVAALDSLRRIFEDSTKLLGDHVRKAQRAITSPPPMLRRPPEGRPETRKDSISRAQLDSTNRQKRDRYFETVMAGRRDLAADLLALKALYDSTLDSTIKSLDGAQHTSVALALERAAEEFTRMLRLANIR